MKKIVLISFLAVGLILTGMISKNGIISKINNSKGQSISDKKIKTTKSKVNLKDTISIIGVGDMMLGTNYPAESYLPPEDGKNILTPVKQIIENADISFGNLEGAILSGSGTVKTCTNPAVCYAFKMPNHYVNYFKEAGFMF